LSVFFSTMESLWSGDDRLIIPGLSKSGWCYKINGEIGSKGSIGCQVK
jgi:hypothetical protein